MSEETKKTPAVETAKQDLTPASASTVPAAPALGLGHEDRNQLDQSDYEIPRARIIQFTSEEAQSDDPNDRIAPGKFINGLSKAELSPVFIPLKRYKTYTRWNPRKIDDPNYDPAYEKGALIFSTQDRHDSRIVSSSRILKDRDDKDVEVDGLSFGPKGESPLITEAYNFLCCFEGQGFPMLLSFQKTSHKAGKILNTLLLEAGGDMFSNKFKLIFKQEENAGNKYYVMHVRANGKATPEEYENAKKWFGTFKSTDEIEAKAQKVDQGFHEQ